MLDFQCTICGNVFVSQAEADKCKNRGITMFSRKVGDRVQFTESKKSAGNGPWVYEEKEGTVKKIDLVIPNRYPGHEYGVAAMFYLVEEDSGKQSWRASLNNDQMRTVPAEKFVIEAAKMDPKLSGPLKQLQKFI